MRASVQTLRGGVEVVKGSPDIKTMRRSRVMVPGKSLSSSFTSAV